MPTGQGEGVFGYASDGTWFTNSKILNNSFYSNFGCVINSVNADGLLWSGNNQTGWVGYASSLCAGVYPEASKNGLLTRNFVKRLEKAAFYGGVENSNRYSTNITSEYNVYWSPVNKLQVNGAGTVGRMVANYTFRHDTFIATDTNSTVNSQFLYFKDFINLTFVDNIVYMDGSGSSHDLMEFNETSRKYFNYNLWYVTSGTPTWDPYGATAAYTSLADYQTGTANETNSVYGDPLFSNLNNSNFTPLYTSPACNAASDGGDIGAFACEDAPPSSGNCVIPSTNWVINETCRYNSTTLSFGYNLTIANGGSLILNNSILKFNSSGQYLTILTGGQLKGLEGGNSYIIG
jgi:hypothetical protein